MNSGTKCITYDGMLDGFVYVCVCVFWLLVFFFLQNMACNNFLYGVNHMYKYMCIWIPVNLEDLKDHRCIDMYQ